MLDLRVSLARQVLYFDARQYQHSATNLKYISKSHSKYFFTKNDSEN